MQKQLLNVAFLNGGESIHKGGGNVGGGGVQINNQDKVIDIAENGTTEVIADDGYTGLGKVTVNVDVVTSGSGDTPSRPTYTGHADVEGLKAIGWTDEDIAYYQANGVNWNEEDDEYHKVPEDNIALYGVLTASNISTYKDRIVYLPKIDTSGRTSMGNMFSGFAAIVAIPQLDTSNVTNMSGMFYNCYSFVSIPQLDTSNVTDMSQMFSDCYSLVTIPKLDTSNVTAMNSMFNRCYSLVSIPQLDTLSVTKMNSMFGSCSSLVSIPQLDTSNVTNMNSMFYNCYSLVSIPQLDTSNVTTMSDMLYYCYSIQTAKLKGIKNTLLIIDARLFKKDSLLYIINNEASTSAITITLRSYSYNKYATDPDVVAALSNHPNISLAKY